MSRSRYALEEMDRIRGVKAPVFRSPHFREFVVDFGDTGKTVAEINEGLLGLEIFGGKDLTPEYPELGGSALFCVSEVHTREDIDQLTAAVKEIVD